MRIYVGKRNCCTNNPTKWQEHSYFFFFVIHYFIMENILKICGLMDILKLEK